MRNFVKVDVKILICVGRQIFSATQMVINFLRQVNNKVSLHRITRRHGKNTTKNKVGNLIVVR